MREALRPIFRDRDELPASPDLSQQIDQALAASRALIVLCSPSAARSQWTNAEIVRFKRLHPDRPILAVLIAGEPYASAIPGREDEEAFPPALRFQLDADGALSDVRAEPIAADVRAEADGKRLAKLKVIAGLLGARLDDLVRRETARRNRRLMLTAGLSLAGMAMTSGLAVYAFRQRAEAVREREQADGLIEFMLTDLRRKLEPIGRLDALDSVGEKVLRYYAAQDLAALDADALARRAQALQLVGEVATTRGNLARAMPLFEQAAATTAEQLRRDPDNPQRIFDHAQSVYWVGYVAWQRGDLKTARSYFVQYRDFANRLSPWAIKKPQWAAEAGYANINLGSVELETDQFANALGDFVSAQQTFAQLHRRQPDDDNVAFSVAQTFGWKADAERELGRSADALGDRRREIEVYRTILAEDPRNTKVSSSMSNAMRMSARLKLDLGMPRDAVSLADQSLGVIKPLALDDPTNGLWREMAIKSSNMRVEALMMVGEWGRARSENAQAIDRARKLVATNRTISNWRTECLMPALWMEIAIARTIDTPAALRARIDRFEQEFPTIGGRKDDDDRFAHAFVLTVSGLDHLSRHDAAAAHRDFSMARPLLPALSSPMDPRVSALTRAVYDLDRGKTPTQVFSGRNAANYRLNAILFSAGR